ncbi:MAG: NADP-dependent oxidoreductase [Gammaproteobacteria bacterium]|nr:NADP-dependent oxidoreductase [Gammaproteobacteria bacterium]MXY55767.1 NADP-dependent oxidoreductase [Gammaproteobacteria bacterium]MYF28466.1 NADP-dependent oxidoreductase [Gammaproteobacteria bacterium]MYK47238.1 NADP-dependent oxidoreductase [Gammaproteobacteria bacterium]
MPTTNRKVVMKQPPVGVPTPADFEIVSESLGDIGDGQMLLKTRWLTLDPYMRSVFMQQPDNVGKTVIGGTVSEVVDCKAPAWEVGDLIVGCYGWQEYSIGTASDVQWNNPNMPIEKWDGSLGEPSTALGVLGMTGYTAYEGLLNVAKVQPGETVVVSAASGAVGQVVGQLAKIHGARAVGIAGGPAKCGFCIDELGFDTCVDYKAGNLAADLAAATPDGIDIYFENVGGEILEAVIPRLNPGARIPICGFIAHYNETPDVRRMNPLQRLQAEGLPVLGRDGNTEGYTFFGFSNLASQHPQAEQALKTLSAWIKSGQLKYRESITDGLDSAIDAFIGMLCGRNFGKTLVRVSG